MQNPELVGSAAALEEGPRVDGEINIVSQHVPQAEDLVLHAVLTASTCDAHPQDHTARYSGGSLCGSLRCKMQLEKCTQITLR